MNRCIHMKGEAIRLTLSNLGTLEGADLNPDDLNEAEDVREVMEQVEAYAQSYELDLATEVQSFTVLPTDGIELEEEAEEETTPLTLDRFELKTRSLNPVVELIASARSGDVIYLRREHGLGEWRLCYDPDEVSGEYRLDYFDCARFDLDDYQLISESYFDHLCDTLIPQTMAVGETPATLEYSLFEPRIVYGELYRVMAHPTTGTKLLERVAIPGHYFLAEEVESDELIDEA